MPYAMVLTTASKASLTGGTFADTLTANTGDSLNVANYINGDAKIAEMWGIDSASVMEGQLVYTRPDSTHDQQHGFRFEVPALVPGGAGYPAGHNILPGNLEIPVFPGDAATISVSGTASDAVAVSFLTEYADLPGASAQFATWEQVQALRKSTVGINCLPVGSATKGAYGATRALNADDNRGHAMTYYAILGFTLQTACLTVSLIGPPWGGQRIGLPGGVLEQVSPTWFIDQSIKRNKPLIPVFNWNDAGNILLQVADCGTSTSPKLDLIMYELTRNPLA